LQAVGFVERRAAVNSRRELQLFLSRRGRAFLTDLRSRRESTLEAVLEQMPAVQRTALLRGLESFCAAAAAQIHDTAAADAATA
jgi:DNA-binding MarR family transcriptional regulator